jgi:hypothetical protein
MCVLDTRFEVVTAEKTQIVDFWVLARCSVVVRYQSFGVPCCLHLQNSTLKMEAAHYTVLQPRIPRVQRLCLIATNSSTFASLSKLAGVAQSVWRLDYGLDDQGSIPGRGNNVIFSFATVPTPALSPTLPPIQWVPGALTPMVKRPGRETDIHIHVVPMLRMRGTIPPLPQYVSTA